MKAKVTVQQRVAPDLDDWLMLAATASSEAVTTAPRTLGQGDNVHLQAANHKSRARE
jgi:hypothetical protein